MKVQAKPIQRKFHPEVADLRNFRNPANLLCDLLGLDYESQLGSGHFAKAFKTSRGTVLKLTVDSKYMKYVELCEKSDNPFLPKILNNFGVVAYIGEDNVPVHAVELEKYLEIYEADIYWNDEQEENYELSEYFRELKSSFGFCHEFYKHIGETITKNTKHPVWNIAKIYNLDLFPFLDALHLIFNHFKNDNGIFFDLHQGNFMLTESGQMIITDPVGDCDVVDSGLHVTGGESTYADFLNGVDKQKVETLRGLTGGSKLKSIITNFKANVMQHKPVGSKPAIKEDSFETKILVKVGNQPINEYLDYRWHCSNIGKIVVEYDRKSEEALKRIRSEIAKAGAKTVKKRKIDQMWDVGVGESFSLEVFVA